MLKHFKSFLSEQTMLYMIEEVTSKKASKNTPHVEDHLLMHGLHGFGHAYDSLMLAHNHIKSGGSSADLTTEHEGNPSIVFGSHPDNKKFFVATTSSFTKTPKVNYTHEDIEKNHGNEPELAEKLHASLEHLRKVTPKGKVYQGDILYDEYGLNDRKNGNVSFTPKNIRYTASGDLSNKIKKSKLGITVNRQYEGDSVDSMTPSPYPDVHNFKSHNDVWINPQETNTTNVKYPEAAQKEFNRQMEIALAIHNKNYKKMYDATAPHQGESGQLMSYIGNVTKNGDLPHSDGLSKHIEKQYKKQIDKLDNSSPEKEAKQKELKDQLEDIDNNSEHYHNLMRLHHHLNQAKNQLVNVLGTSKSDLNYDIDGTATTPTGYSVTYKGHSSKLVDREKQ